MSDSEEEVQRPQRRSGSSLLNRSSTPELDEKDVAERSHLSARIEEAEEFELTFEIVEKSTVDEEERNELFKKDEEIEKILSPSLSKEKNLPVQRRPLPADINLEKENDENISPPRKKIASKRKSIVEELKAEWDLAPSEKRKILVEKKSPLGEKSTPKSSKA